MKEKKIKTKETETTLTGEELNEFLIKLGNASKTGIRRKIVALKRFLKQKLNIEFASEQTQHLPLDWLQKLNIEFASEQTQHLPLDWQLKKISNYSYTKEEREMPLRPALIKTLIDDFSRNHPSEPVAENWHEELSAKLKNSLAFRVNLDKYETKTHSMIGKIIFEEESGVESNVEFDISAVLK